VAKQDPGPDNPRLPRPLLKLAERLLALDEGLQADRRALRRLESRVSAANGHRRRLLDLTAALLRLRHGAQLEALGAEPYDVAEAAVDTPFDGLLIALVQAARRRGVAVERLLLAGDQGDPDFAAEVLGLPVEAWMADGRTPATASPAAAVVFVEDLLADAALAAALCERATLVVARFDPARAGVGMPPGEAARKLVERLGNGGLEALHVSGCGTQIAFGREGLLPQGRADGFSANAR
jgi:hypothetical protein